MLPSYSSAFQPHHILLLACSYGALSCDMCSPDDLEDLAASMEAVLSNAAVQHRTEMPPSISTDMELIIALKALGCAATLILLKCPMPCFKARKQLRQALASVCWVLQPVASCLAWARWVMDQMCCNVLELNHCCCSSQCDEALAEAQEQAGSSAQAGTSLVCVWHISICIMGRSSCMPLPKTKSVSGCHCSPCRTSSNGSTQL